MKSSSFWINYLLPWLSSLLLCLPTAWQALRETSNERPKPWELEDAYRTIEYNPGSAPQIEKLLGIPSKTTTATEDNPSASSSKSKLISSLFFKKKAKPKGQVNERGPVPKPHHLQAMSIFPIYANAAETWYKDLYSRYTNYHEIRANSILRENFSHEDFQLVQEFSAAFFIHPEMMADLIQAVFEYILKKRSISHLESLIWFDLLARVSLAGDPKSLNQDAEAALQQGLISFLAKVKSDKTFLKPDNEYELENDLPSTCVEKSAEVLLTMTKTRWTTSFVHLSSAIEHIPFAQEIVFPQLGLSKSLRMVDSFINLIKFDEKLHGLCQALQEPNLPCELHETIISSISRMATIHAATSAQTKTAAIVLLSHIKHGLIGETTSPLKELAFNELSKLEKHESGPVLSSHDDTLIRGCLKQGLKPIPRVYLDFTHHYKSGRNH